MSELTPWKYSLENEKRPMHYVWLEADTYHDAARELARRLDDVEEPTQFREIWLLDPKHDTPRRFEVHSETLVRYYAYEMKGSSDV